MTKLRLAAERILKQGPRIFVVSVLAYGVLNLIGVHCEFMDFASGAHLQVIPWVPGKPWLAYLTGLAFIAPSISLLIGRKRQVAAIWLGLIFIVYAVSLAPLAAAQPLDISLRTIVFETLSMSGGAFVLAGILPCEFRVGTHPRMFDMVGRSIFAISLVVFGVDHFLMPRGITQLIPYWIPFRLFWAWFTGFAFIASGISIVTRRFGNLGASLLGLMFLLWVLLLHLPRTLGILAPGAGLRSPAEWSSMFIALAICGASWSCVESVSLARSVEGERE